jgi:hypothetical protein
MIRQRAAFTLIEVLISIFLMGLMLPALYQTVILLQESNGQLWEYLQKSKEQTRAAKMFYLDIASSDGNLSLKNDEFDRICMPHTMNSLYGLAEPKVCWVVLKEDHTLVRVEGVGYHLPVKDEEHVAVDVVMKGVDLFDIYWNKDKVLAMVRQKGKTPITFMVQGITKPKPPKKKNPSHHNHNTHHSIPTTPTAPTQTTPTTEPQVPSEPTTLQ